MSCMKEKKSPNIPVSIAATKLRPFQALRAEVAQSHRIKNTILLCSY